MKILLVNNLYPPYTRGGAEQVVVATAHGLRDAGHEVVVLTAEPFRGLGSLWPRAMTEDGICVLRFYPLNLFFYANDYRHNTLVRFFWHLGNLINLHSALVFWRLIRSERPDVVHFHNINGVGFLLPFVTMIASGAKRSCLTLHGLQYAIPDGIMTVGHERDFRVAGFLVRWYARLVSVLLRPIDAIISPSQYLLDFYASRGFFGRQKKIVIRNPISHFYTVQHRSEGGGLRLLYVGQIEDHKGIFFLLDALASPSLGVASSPSLGVATTPSAGRAPWELTIVGTGTQTGRLTAATTHDSRIQFVGSVPHDKLYQYFAAADFLIFPSLYYENMPMVIAEAFAHGLPVIASRIGGVSEMVKEGKNGLLFAPGDSEGLRESITRALQSRATWASLQLVTRTKASEYALDHYIAQIIGLYTSP